MGIIRDFIRRVSNKEGIVSGRRKVFTDLLRDVRGIREEIIEEKYAKPWAIETINSAERICEDTISYISGRISLDNLRQHLKKDLTNIEILVQKQGLEREEAMIATTIVHVQNPKYPDGLLLLRLKEIIELTKIIIVTKSFMKESA